MAASLRLPSGFSRNLATVALLCGFGALVGCQTTDPQPVAPSGSKAVGIQIPDASLVPDSAYFRLGTLSGTVQVVAPSSGAEYTLKFEMPRAMGADTLKVYFVSASLVTTIIPFRQSGDGSLSTIGTDIVRDAMARAILLRLGVGYPRTSAGAIAAYADALVKGDANFKGYPANAPIGLDTAQVKLVALRLASTLQKPLASIVSSWFLNLNFEQARAAILALVPPISSSDSAMLFPPPPVRVSQAVSVGAVAAQGGAIALKGTFAADAPLMLVEFKVFQGGVDVSNQFSLFSAGNPAGAKTTWDLESDARATLQALTALPGGYSLKITALDNQQRTIVVTLDFAVSAVTDKLGPTIVAVAPKPDTIVANAVAEFDVQATVTDPSGIETVLIAGLPAHADASGIYHGPVALLPTGLATPIEIKAFDKQGNSSSTSVSVTRKAPEGATAPVFRLVSPAKGSVFPFDSAFAKVVWVIRDAGSIVASSVRIGGVSATLVDDSTWSARVPLAPTGLDAKVMVEAVNAKGIGGTDSLKLQRRKDTLRPVVVPVLGSRTVSYDSIAALASWTVTDNHKLASVSIGGKPLVLDPAGVYSTQVLLRDSSNLAVLLATDSTGNSRADTIRITRAADITGPGVTVVYPAAEEVIEYGTATILVRVRVSDPSGVQSVSIGQIAADTAAGEYRASVAVPPTGTPTLLVVHALDRLGNATDLSVRVTRKAPPENVPPVMTLLSPAAKSGTVVPFDSASVLVRWKIADPYGVVDSTVKINGVRAVKGSDSTWSLRVPLPPNGSPTLIVCEAANSKGVGTTDVATLARQKDAVAPTTTLRAGQLLEVPFATNRLAVGWTVLDNHKLASVSINGQSALGATSLCSLSVALAVGSNLVRIVATDSTGNLKRDSATVVRLADKILPVIARASIPATPLQFSKTVTVLFTVTDNDAVASVTINGKTIAPNGSAYSAVIALEPGANQVSVVATDPSGNKSTDALTLTTILTDRDGNSYRFGRMPDGKVWTLENLRTVPSAASMLAGGNGSQTKCYGDVEANCLTSKGRYYSWAMAMNLPAICDTTFCLVTDTLSHQGICPSGWHVSSLGEWSGLVAAASGAGGTQAQGLTKLKSTKATMQWKSMSIKTCQIPNDTTITDFSGTDDYGFSLLPLSGAGGGGQCGWGSTMFSMMMASTQGTAKTFSHVYIHDPGMDFLDSPKFGSDGAIPSPLRCVAD